MPLTARPMPAEFSPIFPPTIPASVKLSVFVPEAYLGDVLNDLHARRADVQANEMRGALRELTARAPLREMFGYATRVRSLSQGRANYVMEPLEYAQVPAHILEQIVG